MYTTDSFPQGHRPYLHTTFNCILSKTFARSTTKSGGAHKLCLFPSQASLSIPLAQHHQRTKFKRPSNVVPAFPNNNRWQQTSPTMVSKFPLLLPPPPRGPGGWRGRGSPHHRCRRPARRATARASTRHPCGPHPTSTGSTRIRLFERNSVVGWVEEEGTG